MLPGTLFSAIAAILPLVGAQTFNIQYKLSFHSCSNKQQTAILDGLKEAQKILGADGNYYFDGGFFGPGSDFYNSANAVDFFGAPADIKLNNARAGIGKNFRNAYSFSNGWWFSAATTDIYCNDGSMSGQYQSACSAANYPDPIVVVPNYSNGKVGMMFCSRWFDYGKLDDIVKQALAQPPPRNYDISKYDNRARHWITALMLNPKVGTYPTDNRGPNVRYLQYPSFTGQSVYATKAYQCREMAALRDGQWQRPVINPDNYSWYALASYVQSAGELGEVPVRLFAPGNGVY